MIQQFYYNKETRSFGWSGNLMTGLAIAGTAAQLATLPKQLSNKEKYGVAGLGLNGKPINKTLMALSGQDAINKVKKSYKGSKFKAFKIPEQDDQYSAYIESLSELRII